MNKFYDLKQYGAIFGNIYRQEYTNNPDYMSFEGWRQRCRQTREKLLEMKRTNAEMLAGLGQYYSQRIIDERKAALDEAFYDMRTAAAGLIQTDFDMVEGFKKLAMEGATAAPSDEALRLLTALSMRKSIDPSEFVTAARKCSDNLNALRVLSDLADRHGVGFPAIEADDVFTSAVETVKGWRRIAAEDCAVDDGDLGYMARLFWAEGGNGGMFGVAAEKLDSPNFLRVDDADLERIVRKTGTGTTNKGVTSIDTGVREGDE